MFNDIQSVGFGVSLERLELLTKIPESNKKIHFERAIFISWYCSLGDCTYCYMSTQKNLISDPNKARRSTASILAEAYLCKKLGWKVSNLAAGYGSYTPESILELVKGVYSITNEKLWLNIGVLPEKTIEALKPYLEGIYGAVETTNEAVHKKVAPNKPIAPIERMFKICDKEKIYKSCFIRRKRKQAGPFDLQFGYCPEIL
ncbi:MAG: hypothetical protein IH949_02640 [Bacteroidetes bacterium]|nr:hypothetical protein [Bacteroidota bacterium]